MATRINQVDVMNALHNLMGHRVNPGGTDDDYKRYIQDSFDYCWRYYRWGFSLKTADVADDGILPEDFDYEGYREFNGVTEVTLGETIQTGNTGSAIIFDNTTGRYKLEPAVACTVVYQYEPPTLGSDETGYAPFPSAMTVAVGCTVLAKQGANPTRADVQQEWDSWHSRLDRLVGRADNAKPRRPQSYHDRAGTYVGNVGV